jgi:putative iron-dependent peroxidase
VSVTSAAEPQAILSPITEAAIFLTLTIEPGGEAAARTLLSDVNGLRQSVGFRIPEAGMTCVAAVGAAAWDRLFGLSRPAGLHPFREVHGPRHSAPATPGDLFFHIRAHRFDLCFALAQLLVKRLDVHARAVDEVHGSARSTSATCSASSMAPRTRKGRQRSPPC